VIFAYVLGVFCTFFLDIRDLGDIIIVMTGGATPKKLNNVEKASGRKLSQASLCHQPGAGEREGMMTVLDRRDELVRGAAAGQISPSALWRGLKDTYAELTDTDKITDKCRAQLALEEYDAVTLYESMVRREA
jgi:hypothetical protein